MEGEPRNVTVPNDRDASVLLPTVSYHSFDASPSILQRSTAPSLAANLTLEGVPVGGGMGLGADGRNISISPTRPEVDVTRGVSVSGAGNGIYFARDEVFIVVW